MGRRYREHLPGAAFHVVSRTQGHSPWLSSMRDEAARLIKHAVTSAGARLIAYAVMPNHVHILLIQSRAALGWTLQPAFRGIALMVQRSHGVQGHVFERRFRSKMCADQLHLRNSLLYIHRNPLAANLCSDAGDYEWSSHTAYAGTVPCSFVSVEEGLRIVACTDGTPDELRAIYLREFDTYCRSKADDGFSWTTATRMPYSRAQARAVITRFIQEPPLADLRDAAHAIVKLIDPHCDMDLLRSPYRGAAIRKVRTQLIAALHQRGYSGTCISEYLHVSESTVSRVVSMMRTQHDRGG